MNRQLANPAGQEQGWLTGAMVALEAGLGHQASKDLALRLEATEADRDNCD